MDVVFRYWDGANYVYLAKTLYNIPADHPLSAYSTAQYFSAHLPLYPFTIRAFSFMGYNNAMIFSTVLYTLLATLTFYQLLRETNLVASPFWSAILSLFLPARYLIYHNVGATEAPFLFFTLASLLCYIRGQHILAFFLGGLSGITRITGILIGVAYFISLIYERKWRHIPWLALIALPLFLTFVFYYFHYGDFFAYFSVNYSSINRLIHFTPFEIFTVYSNSGDTHSAELYLILYVVYGVGVLMLWGKNRLLFFYAAISYVFSTFIFHQDLSRFLIPLAPFALVIAYDEVLSKTAMKIAAIPFIAMSYIYAWGVMPHNLVVDWVYEKLIQVLAL